MPDYRTRRRKFPFLSVFLKKLLFPKKQYYSVTSVMLWSRITTIAFFGLIVGIVLIIGLFLWYSRDLPKPGQLVNNNLSESTRIYDKSGILLYSVYKNENREYVQLKDIPAYLQEATIAIEDRNFYKNQGFSVNGYLRATRDIILLRGVSGGSTLTQQLVKNVLLTNERTLPRKIKELILAIQVDKTYSKDQILEMYLNDVGYGGANTGVEAAAETYFGKHVKELDLAQSAVVAGLPQDPNYYDPLNGQRNYVARSYNVLQAMVSQGNITQKQADTAYNELKNFTFLSPQDASIKAPWFVLYVKQLLAQQFGDNMVENGGLQVTTTLDYGIEQKAEQIVKDQVTNLGSLDVGNGAALIMDPQTGDILAMVGGKDYFGDPAPNGCKPGVNCIFEPNINATIINRQPGSSLKPVMYATAFEKGYTPATMIMDVKTDFPTGDPTSPIYTPVNYDGKYHGPVQLRFALANSLNIPAVKMLARVGIKDVMQNAFNMGIQNWNPTSDNLKSVGLSLVLGGRETTLLDEVTTYSVFATGGIKRNPVFITKVTDSKGNVLYQAPTQSGNRVLPEDVTFLISHILSDNNARTMEFGPYSSLVVSGKTVSVKTGTTDSKRDNWTVGYTPDYVVGVWVGNDDNETMNQQLASGITGAAPIWNAIMSTVLKGKPDNTWLQQPPSDVTAMQIDALFGGLPVDGQPTRSEYFIKGTQPTGPSPVYKKIGDKTYYVIHEDDPVSTDGQNRWQAGINDWIKQNHSAADWQWYPPSDALTGTPTPTPSPTP
ncbi:MAG TPA: PBP1A family penicillin-binding protein [Patescibacteria group bacterium]|nr:PBP1A family penicillin-binding protein [Patescibacteria group bacterium]